jgi:hypothetical protein
MAYVVWIVTHPDHQEPMVIDGSQTVNANIATLLLERGDWKVHQLGEALSPMAVGLVPYSW